MNGGGYVHFFISFVMWSLLLWPNPFYHCYCFSFSYSSIFRKKKTMAWNFQWLKCLSFYHRDIAILKFWKHYKNRQKGWPWALEPSTMIAFQSLLSMWQPCLGMIWYFLWILVLKVWKQLWNWQESGVMKRKRSPTMRYNYENHVS